MALGRERRLLPNLFLTFSSGMRLGHGVDGRTMRWFLASSLRCALAALLIRTLEIWEPEDDDAHKHHHALRPSHQPAALLALRQHR